MLFRALETGVSAFVGQTAPVEEMLAAIRHAAVAASSFTASGLAVALARRQTVQERLALSPRETEVLGLLGDGLSIPAIAARMFISQSTAKTYVARLYEKLGAGNRAQALMTAIHYGLIRYSGTASYDGTLSMRTASSDIPPPGGQRGSRGRVPRCRFRLADRRVSCAGNHPRAGAAMFCGADWMSRNRPGRRLYDAVVLIRGGKPDECAIRD